MDARHYRTPLRFAGKRIIAQEQNDASDRLCRSLAHPIRWRRQFVPGRGVILSDDDDNVLMSGAVVGKSGGLPSLLAPINVVLAPDGATLSSELLTTTAPSQKDHRPPRRHITPQNGNDDA